MVCGRLNMLVFFMVMGLAVSNAQTTHTVGGALGWTVPSGGAAVYTTWASGQNFTVGDVLVFNFPTGAHTAAEVTKAAYDACTTTGTLSQFNAGPARVTLNSSGQHYYLCTIPTHCSGGQKLAINVSAASTPPPAAAPTPAATPPRASAPAPVPTTPPASAPALVPTPPPASAPAPVPTPPPSSAPTPRATPPTASTPSSPATPPPSSPTSPPPPGTNPSTPPPTGDTAPPPPNSAASFAGVALPVTFLAVAMALFY